MAHNPYASYVCFFRLARAAKTVHALPQKLNARTERLLAAGRQELHRLPEQVHCAHFEMLLVEGIRQAVEYHTSPDAPDLTLLPDENRSLCRGLLSG